MNVTTPRCYDWNESKCAKGFVQKNYADNSRVNEIVPMSNVKLVNSDDLKLYGCPVEDNLVIVAKQSRIKFRKEDVISSTQAEGIFHKIQDITYTGNNMIININRALKVHRQCITLCAWCIQPSFCSILQNTNCRAVKVVNDGGFFVLDPILLDGIDRKFNIFTDLY